MENDKTKIRKLLETIEHEIHLSWLRDLDKTIELQELIKILEEILNCNSIEEYFENIETDFDYFIKKFSKESINNILRQHYIYGENGDEIASNVLLLYLKLFLKFYHFNNYIPLWESVKEIFDSSKPYYKGMGFNMNSKIDQNKRFKKQMSAECFNETFLKQNESRFSCIKEGEEIDIYIDNKRSYQTDKKIWTRGQVVEVTETKFSVKTSEESSLLIFAKHSFEYAPAGSMTKDYEWRMNLQPFDLIDCQDRGRWFPATVTSRKEEFINDMKKVEYRIGFRIYPENLPDWKNYTKFWPEKTKAVDSNNRVFFGDQEGYDETIPAISKRIQKFGMQTGGAAAKNSSESGENLCIDDFILFEHDQGKSYVVAKSSNFSFYFALLINNFAALGGFESLLNLLKKDADSKEKLNAELLYYIFNFIASASSLFHKEYMKILAEIMKDNVIKFLNELSQNDLRNMKKETIELITKVLKYYLSFTLSQEERNEVVENFGLSFSLKMLKTSLLDKRISAVKTIVDLIKSAKHDPDKCTKVLKIIEDHKIFYEIYGSNSHIQLINKSKDLLEIMLQEDKLSSGEMEIIWNGTKKGDLEGKLTILKTLKEISQSLKEKHIKMLLDNIYQSEPQVLINEEIDLIYDLATHPSQPENELEKCIKFFLNGLFASKTDDPEKTGILVNKIFQITTLNKKLMVSVLNDLIDNIEQNKNAYLSFKLLGKFIVDKENIYGNNNNNVINIETRYAKEADSPRANSPAVISDDAITKSIFEENLVEREKIVNLFIQNFTEYKNQVRTMVDNKNWTKDIDLLPFDNFTYSQNIRARLNFLDVLISENVWNTEPDPIDFIFEILNNNPICEKDTQEFYKWVKKFIEKNPSFEMEEKIFNLFNNKICSDNKKCQNLSIQAFESYLKIFLDINKIKENLDYTYYREKLEVKVFCLPETLIGFDILWKIVFESFSTDIMNKGIETLHLLYNNIQAELIENQSEILLKKCIDLINITVESNNSAEEKHNIITKCLHVLNLMIEESEKKGTARVKSHTGLIKNKILKLKINSFISKVPDSYIKVFGNTTIWDLKEIISKKVGVAVDFLKLRIENYDVCDTDNGKTIQDFNLEEGDDIKTFMNSLDQMIPQAELLSKTGQVVPQVIKVFNEWYDNYSTEGKMAREDCARFVKAVTNARDDIAPDDHRVNFLFSTYDVENLGHCPREGFVSFYVDATRKPEKKNTVWENLKNMGYRNDLKRLDEPYEFHNIDKTVLPRYKMAHNESFFNTIFYLQDLNENIAKEAFNFLCKITTNPTIYRNILDGRDNWKALLDANNIYKLIYSLQIIESFLEDIEIDFEGVDSFSNEEAILGLDSDGVEALRLKKIEWMENFVRFDGFKHLVDILHSKLSEFTYLSKDSTAEPSLMSKICIQFLLKIIRIFYNSSLNRYEIIKKVNQLITHIKRTSSTQEANSTANISSSQFPSVPKKSSENLIGPQNVQDELAAYLDNEEPSTATPSTRIDYPAAQEKEQPDPNSNFEIKRKNSMLLDSNTLDRIFEAELGDRIIHSLNNTELITNLIDLLINFNSKNKISNEDADIMENSFELFCALISFSEKGEEIETLILNKKKSEFSKLCLHGLLNKSLSIREKYSYSLIKLCKISTHNQKFNLVAFLFSELFKFISIIENNNANNLNSFINSNDKNNLINIDSTSNNNNANSNQNQLNQVVKLNDKSAGESFNYSELFEFFSHLFEIYLSNKETFDKILKEFSISPEEFLMNLAKSVSDDINNLNNVNLKNEIFIGYLKILSKVCESITDVKEKISQNFNLIQDIMTKILFRQSNKELNEKLDKLKFINPDVFSDHKANRNTNQQIRNSCFKFILAMLNNSIKNFEKFFQINILDTASENANTDKDDTDFPISSTSNRTAAAYSQLSRYNFYNSYNTKVEDHVGLKNLGCICYMNSMLQQFFMVPSFRRALLQVDDDIAPNTKNPHGVDDNVFHQVQRMFSHLELSNREDYNPEGFCFSFKDWDGNPTNTSIQQDAQEFLSRFIDKIESALKPTNFKYLMHSVFGGKSCSQLVCEDGCGTAKNRFEDMFCLSLEVSNMKTIYDSLEKYISPEKIDEYQCETCNKKVTITKRNVLSDLPNVLIVHLQRIFYNYETDRNEKINSRLEFPKVLNLKNYTIEEMARKNAAKHASAGEKANTNTNGNNEEEGSAGSDLQFENDEIYFKHNDYYEYHLVGVNVHIGSADAGHYFSYINAVRNGDDSKMAYDPESEQHSQNWLKFNDSRISKFNIQKLEEECFGGKMDNGESDSNTWNFRSNYDSIQSAYMLVYERRVKSPIKVLVTEQHANEDNLISYKEEQEKAIKKNFDLMYHLGKPTLKEMQAKIFHSVFYENSRNEYYQFIPFFEIERLIPKKYYLEITEDNNQLEKHQNITDENSSNFFESVINLLDDAINQGNELKEEICDKIVVSFINFIFNILSNKDKEKLLKVAKQKFVLLIGDSKNRLNTVFTFLLENNKSLHDCIFNENPSIVQTHCDLLFDVILKTYQSDPKSFMESLNKEKDASVSDLFDNCGRLIENLLNIFPKVNSKLVNRTVPILYLLRNISNIHPEIAQYFASKELVFILVTFLLGRESPCYSDTFSKASDNWDTSRPNLNNPLPIIEIVHAIFLLNVRWEEDKENNLEVKLSDRDLKCLKHPAFLKLIYKNSQKIFCDLLTKLSKDDFEFTKMSCLEITKFIDDILIYDENETFKLVNSILKILEIEDEYQYLRFNILLGYPQLLVEEPNYKSNQPQLGYYLFKEYKGKYIEIRGLYSVRNTSSLMKKFFSLKFREKNIIEIFLTILNASRTNLPLLKYIRNFNAEDNGINDFVNFGIGMINNGKKLFKDTNYLDELKVIVTDLNNLLSGVMDKITIPGFNGFLGKFMPKDLKREIYDLIYAKEGVYVFKIDYYTNITQDLEEIDENQPEETEQDEEHKDEYVFLNYDSKAQNEKEFLKRIIANIQQSNKKVCVERIEAVKNNFLTTTRYLAYNANSRDVNITLKFNIDGVNPETKPNEYLPAGAIITHVGSFNSKNLIVLSKLLPEKKWRFEVDESQPNAKLTYEFDLEFLEFKANNNCYGYNNSNMRLNLANMGGHERYGQVRNDKMDSLVAKKDLLCLEGISCLSFNKDFTKCVLSKKDNNLYIYEVTAFTESSTWVLKDILRGHLNYISAVDWHPETNRILSSSHDRTIMIWNYDAKLNTWQHEMAILNIKVAVLDAKWGKRGDKFAAGTGSKLVCTGFWCSESKWWQCKSMKDHKSSVITVRLDDSGLFMISGSLDMKVIISSAFIDKLDEGVTQCGTPLQISPHGTILMNFTSNAWVNSVCWSPSNKFCFAASHDAIISVINNAENKKDSIYLNHSAASSIIPISDEEIMVICFDRHIYRYKLDNSSGEWKMTNSITKAEADKPEEPQTGMGSSVANRLRMFNNAVNKKQSIVVGSVNQKNIHSSNINSFAISNNQLITSDLSGFVKVWKL